MRTGAAIPKPKIGKTFQVWRSYLYTVAIVIEPSGSLGGGPCGIEPTKSATKTTQAPASRNIVNGDRLLFMGEGVPRSLTVSSPMAAPVCPSKCQQARRGRHSVQHRVGRHLAG